MNCAVCERGTDSLPDSQSDGRRDRKHAIYYGGQESFFPFLQVRASNRPQRMISLPGSTDGSNEEKSSPSHPRLPSAGQSLTPVSGSQILSGTQVWVLLLLILLMTLSAFCYGAHVPALQLLPRTRHHLLPLSLQQRTPVSRN